MRKYLLVPFLSLLCLSAGAINAPDKQLMPLMPRTGLEGKVENQDQPLIIKVEIKAKAQEVSSKKTTTAVLTGNTKKPGNVVIDAKIVPVSNTTTTANKAKTETPSAENKQIKKIEKKNVSFGNLDEQRIASEIKGEMDDEQDLILADLRILWQAAVERSETIRFAILKLSNPDGEQDKKGIVKKILTPITSVAPLVGMTADPVAGGSAIIGGSLLSSLLSDDSLINNHLSRVTDTELVLLAQEVDDLQRQLVSLYCNYANSLERLHQVDKIVESRYKYYTAAQNAPPEVLSVADVFYREAIDMQYKARQEALNTRATLEQFVGNDAVVQVEKNINTRLANQ